MPTVTVEMLAGRSAPLKALLCDELARTVVRVLQVDESRVRVNVIDAPPAAAASEEFEGTSTPPN